MRNLSSKRFAFYEETVLMNRYRLLVIEDALNLGLLYEQELNDDGYEVDIAQSYKSALEYLENKSYDLVILETMMKDTREIEKLQYKLNIDTNLPVVINTAYPGCEQNQAYWPADACIYKSSDISVLKEKIKIFLQ